MRRSFGRVTQIDIQWPHAAPFSPQGSGKGRPERRVDHHHSIAYSIPEIVQPTGGSSGFMLPFSSEDGYHGKWRYAPTSVNMLMEHKSRVYRSENNLADDAPVPPDVSLSWSGELATLRLYYIAENRLHDAVGGLGLLQYLTVPSAALCSFFSARTKSEFVRLSLWGGLLFRSNNMWWDDAVPWILHEFGLVNELDRFL